MQYPHFSQFSQNTGCNTEGAAGQCPSRDMTGRCGIHTEPDQHLMGDTVLEACLISVDKQGVDTPHQAADRDTRADRHGHVRENTFSNACLNVSNNDMEYVVIIALARPLYLPKEATQHRDIDKKPQRYPDGGCEARCGIDTVGHQIVHHGSDFQHQLPGQRAIQSGNGWEVFVEGAARDPSLPDDILDFQRMDGMRRRKFETG